MKKRILSFILSIFSPLFLLTLGLCLGSEDIITLKKAGISDATIQAMVKEKTKETCAFTVQEIVDIKEAGLSDETIRMLINEGSFMKDTETIVYGKDIRPIKFTTARDIIELKNAGVSDETIEAIVIFGSRDVSDIEHRKAWDMLKKMGIIIDMRETEK
jgi:hypothetical protein